MNFRDLDELIHSGLKEIRLDCDITMDPEKDRDYVHGIRIDVDDIVIDGSNHVIDANNRARIFSVSGSNVQIRNVWFKRAYSAFRPEDDLEYDTFRNPVLPCGYGGAIYNRGKLELIECIFSDNHSWSFGGAIVNASELKIYKCFFESNSGYNGGAIFNKSELEIHDSFFERNGGPMFTNHSGSLGLYGETTKFGGAILNEDFLKMDGCVFLHNYARTGGAINNFHGRISASNILFSNNASRFAGAINNRDGEISIYESRFLRNLSNKKWDAFFDMMGLDAEELDSYDIPSDESAGAILNSNILDLYGCKFKRNVGLANSIYNLSDASSNIVETLFSGDFDEEIGGSGKLSHSGCSFGGEL